MRRRRFNRARVVYNSVNSNTGKGRYVNLGAHTWNDFVKQAARRLTETQLPGAEAEGSSRSNVEWYGTRNLQAAIDMAAKGWAEGANEVAKTLDAIPTGNDDVTQWNLDVQGAMPCVGAYVADDPECMWRYSQEQRPAKRMTLIVPASYSASVSPREAMQYAKAVAATTRAIEASQIDVAIWSFSSGVGRDGNKIEALYAVAVREFGEPLDLAKVAFSSHPSWLRRLHFSWREITEGATKAGLACNGYARPNDIDAERAKEVLGSALEDHASVLVCLPSINRCSGMGWLNERSFDQLLQGFRTTIEDTLAKKESSSQ